MLLRLVGSCWLKFETGQTSEPTSANISIVSRSSKCGPTMLRSFAQHIQQGYAGARAPKSGICVPESFVFSSEDPTCCDLFRAFAHDRLTSRNERQHCWSQQCFVLLRAFARALTFLKLNCQHVIRLIRSRDKKLIFQLRDPSLITCRSTKFDSAFCHSVVGKMG